MDTLKFPRHDERKDAFKAGIEWERAMSRPDPIIKFQLAAIIALLTYIAMMLTRLAV